MNMKCGIIGLPNVGKSTLFNVLTQNNIKTANFPFCTIKQNIGIVYVPDQRILKLANISKVKHIIPNTITFVDIAGLVKDASKGRGLGNTFLNNIRETKVICHVVRCFNDNDIIHVEGEINPIRDIYIINNELIAFDINICINTINAFKKEHIKSNDKNIKRKLNVLEKCLSHLNHGNMLRTLKLELTEKIFICYLNFITIKPMIYIANINHCNNTDINIDKIRTIATNEHTILMLFCLPQKKHDMQIKNNMYDQSIHSINLFSKIKYHNIIQTIYNLMNLLTYFTINKKEVKAWAIQNGTTALQAAGKIHTDFKKGFIRAQIISFDDFINCHGEQGAKKSGKIHLEGKKYIIKDGDIINFLFNV